MRSLLKFYKLAYQKKYIFFAFIAILFLLIETAVALFVPYIAKEIIDVALPSGNISEVYRLGGIVVGIALGSVIAMIINNVAAQYLSVYISSDLAIATFEKIQKLSLSNVDQITSGRLLTIVSNDTVQIQNMIRMSFRVFLRAPITLVGAIIMAYITNANMFVVVLILVPVLSFILYYAFKKVAPLFRSLQGKIDNLNSKLEETISGAREIKSFVTEIYEQQKYKLVNEDYNQAIIKSNRILGTLNPLVMIVSNAAIAVIIYISAVLINRGDTTMVGSVMTYIAYIQQIIGSLMIITNISVMISRAMVSAERVDTVLLMEIDIENNPNPKFVELTGKIEFDNVDFAYLDEEGKSDGITLSGLNFKINPGETIGIIGSTGSGKTSLVQLITRMYDTINGKVLIDDVDVRLHDLKNLRKQISFVTQEAIIFEGTITDNILQGKENASLEEMIEASKLAEAYEFIEESTNGFDTYIAQRGASLSGGQRQRLSLARALIRKPKILVLDDSTSAVDANTEAKIKENLKQVDCTTLIVAQKISSIIECDKILVIGNNGKVDAFGKHEEILATSSVYQEIYQSQFGGALNE